MREQWHTDITINPFPHTWMILIDTSRHWFKAVYIGPFCIERWTGGHA